MKKRAGIRAALLAASAMFMLTGCGTRGTDLSKRYPEYFRYTFGSDYRFRFAERVKGDYPYDVYSLTYGDKHEPILPASSIEITPYEHSAASEDLTEEAYYLSYLQSLISNEAADTFRLGFSSLIKNNFGLGLAQASDGIFYFFSDDGSRDGTIYISVLPVFSVDSDDERDVEQAKMLYEPDTGLQICAQSMQSLAQNDQYIVTVLVKLAADVSPVQYKDKFKALVEEYRSVNPQNYAFILKQDADSENSDGGNGALDLAYGILGEPIDYKAHAEAYGKGYMFAKDVRESWRAKYQ